MKSTTDTFLWALWHCTATLMIVGALYVFVAGSSLFPGSNAGQQVALSVSAHLGTTYVHGTLRGVTKCDRVRVRSHHETGESAQIELTTTRTASCTAPEGTVVTFLTTFAGRPETIAASVDGKAVALIQHYE
jgi:hypothetical protein